MSENGKTSLELALDAANDEITRRLTNDPGSFPAHALVKLINDYSRMSDRRAGELDEERAIVTPLEALEALPPERQLQLLTEEVDRLESVLEDYQERIARVRLLCQASK